MAGDKDIDMSKFAPPQAAGLSTKDANKLRDLATKVPELEKLINDILQRLGQAERDIHGHDKLINIHDKSIEELWAELAKKASVNDLKDLLDRIHQLEKDLENVVNHLNSLGNSSGAPVAVMSGGSDDKRVKKLEEKVEDLRNNVGNNIRDINKTTDSLSREIKGIHGGLEDQKNDFLKLFKKVNDLELKLDALLKRGGLNEGTTIQTSGLGGMDDDKLDELRQQLNDLRNDYRGFKNECLNQFNTVSKELDTKASKADLEILKNLIKSRIDDLDKSLNKTKNDLKRALRILSDKVSLLHLNFRFRVNQ
jgi:chromosome segregation ATPase